MTTWSTNLTLTITTDPLGWRVSCAVTGGSTYNFTCNSGDLAKFINRFIQDHDAGGAGGAFSLAQKMAASKSSVPHLQF